MKSCWTLESLGAAVLLIFVYGCDLNFGGCAPDVNDERLELWTVALDGTQRERVYTDWMYGNPVFYELIGLSPDGRKLYYRFGYPVPGLYALDLDSLHTSLVFADDWVDHAALSPDGQQIAYVARNAEIWMASLDSGVKELVLRDTIWLRELQWMPDGRSIAYARMSSHFDRRDEGGVWRLDLATRQAERLTFTSPGWFDIHAPSGNIAYSADTVSVEGLHQMIFVKETRDEEATAIISGEVPRFTVDGRRIYFLPTAVPNGPDSILLTNLDGSDVRTLFTGSQIAAMPILIDEGRSLFVRTGEALMRISLSNGSSTVLSNTEHHRVPNEEAEWESVTPYLDQAVLHGNRAYYFVSKRFFDDGC